MRRALYLASGVSLLVLVGVAVEAWRMERSYRAWTHERGWFV